VPPSGGLSQNGGNGGNGNLNSCPDIMATVSHSSANSCGSVEDMCKATCGSAATYSNKVLGTAEVMNGIGTYSCSCCGNGRVKGGLESDAAADKISVGKVPWSVWVTIGVFWLVTYILRCLTAQPGAAVPSGIATVVREAKEEVKDMAEDEEAQEKAKDLAPDPVLDMAEDLEDVHDSIEADLMCKCCALMPWKKKNKTTTCMPTPSDLVRAELLQHGAGGKAGPKAGSFKAFLVNTHPLLRVAGGNRKLLTKKMSAGKFIFNLCLSFALALAFGGAQFNSGAQYISCARSCTYTSNGSGSSSLNCGVATAKHKEADGLGGEIKFDFAMGAITSLIGICFAPTVGGILKNGMPRGSVAPIGYLASQAARVVGAIGFMWVVLGIVFMVTLSKESSADNAHKMFVVGTIVTNNLGLEWVVAFPTAYVQWRLAKWIVPGNADKTDGDVELQRTTSSSDVNDTVINPMAAKEGNDSEQNPTAQL
jgi:hypothetical protein